MGGIGNPTAGCRLSCLSLKKEQARLMLYAISGLLE